MKMRRKHNREHHHEAKGLDPLGGRVRSFAQPRLLFHLAQKPAHGYELMEQLGEEGGAAIDPALLYRTLHRFQEKGLVSSAWDSESSGPPRVHIASRGAKADEPEPISDGASSAVRNASPVWKCT